MQEADELIEEAKPFATTAEAVQDEDLSYSERSKLLRDLRDRYEEWYRRSLRLIASCNQPQEREKFESEYQPEYKNDFFRFVSEGGITGKIAYFLKEGAEDGELYKHADDDADEALLKHMRWQSPADDTFRQPLNSQLNILTALQNSSKTNSSGSSHGSDRHITVYGGHNAISIGENFTQQVSMDVNNVKEGDLEALLGFLKGQGVENDGLQSLVEAIEGDGDIARDGEFGSRVSTWLGRITHKAVDASFTAIATESVERITKALEHFYGMAVGG